MKTHKNICNMKSEDEYSNLYNWSERTAVFSEVKKQKHQFLLVDSMIDLMCLAATTIAMVNCL